MLYCKLVLLLLYLCLMCATMVPFFSADNATRLDECGVLHTTPSYAVFLEEVTIRASSPEHSVQRTQIARRKEGMVSHRVRSIWSIKIKLQKLRGTRRSLERMHQADLDVQPTKARLRVYSMKEVFCERIK